MQVQKLKQQLFPNNSLQERIENFMPFYAKWGAAFIDIWKKEKKQDKCLVDSEGTLVFSSSVAKTYSFDQENANH